MPVISQIISERIISKSLLKAKRNLLFQHSLNIFGGRLHYITLYKRECAFNIVKFTI